MKASIRRHGIVIRQVELGGSGAKIGSGEQCEIRIDDPYLAAHVADVTRRGDEWRIVDTGTSMEGLARGGSRVEDEAVSLDEPYVVGGFELVFEDAGHRPAAAAAPPVASGSGRAPMLIPETMMEVEAPPRAAAQVPKTIVEVPRPKTAPGTPQFRPMPTASGQPIPPPAAPVSRPAGMPAPAPVAAPPKNRKKLLLIGCAGMAVVLLLVLLLATMGGDKKKEVAVTPTPTPVSTPTPGPVLDPVAEGDRLVGELQIDKALASWEAALDKQATPELQRKYASTAYELALVHAAANDAAGAKALFEKVVKYGEANSPEVQAAKSRLGN
jgi:hypothetical protein